jgi:hypothetical protein
MHRSKAILCLLIGWAVVTGAGLFALAKYQATPGTAVARATGLLPRPVLAAAGKMVLVMFVHPKCPCTDASLTELSTLMAASDNRLHASIFVFQPTSEPDDWSRTRLWTDAANIANTDVRFDLDAATARRYGAATSGQIFLYDQRGNLLYSGGITGSRGHVGDNTGLRTVTGIVNGKIHPATPITGEPVFGCPIYCDDDPIPSNAIKAKP